MNTALVPRRRYQFRLRSLLALVAVLAVVCSLAAPSLQEERRERVAIAAIQRLGGTAWRVPGPTWLRWLGDFCPESTHSVNLEKTAARDAAMGHVAAFRHLRNLSLSGTRITDAGLKQLEGLKELETLSLANTGVTDRGLECLAGMGHLSVLDLNGTQITDAGLEHLKGATQLECLWLNDTLVTDAGLRHLEGLRRLEDLTYRETGVTEDGANALRRVLPQCLIHGGSWGLGPRRGSGASTAGAEPPTAGGAGEP